jgi:Heparan-alpha-glucosaminide N-acetyltransferase, catalytic
VSHAPAPERAYFAELDVLRMLAAALMVANHAGVAWLEPAAQRAGVTGALTFAGGFAPVVFFCVTGMGRGLRAGATGGDDRIKTLQKAALLFLSDAAMWLAPDRWLGLDFLGFIALSSLLVDDFARRARWVASALIALAGCVSLRFVLGPAMQDFLPRALEAAPLRAVLGVAAVEGVSYPLSPWLAFPLLGMLAAGLTARRRSAGSDSRRRSLMACAAAALVATLGCALFVARGFVFHRWGTMSFAYFGASLGVLAAAFALALGLAPYAATARWRPLLALGGSASLVVVPVHYGLTGAIGYFWKPAGAAEFVPALAISVAAIVAVARAFDGAVKDLARVASRAARLGPLVLAIGGLLALALGSSEVPRPATQVVVQLAIAALFVRVGRAKIGSAGR